jgi:hypothetical protein
VTEPAEDDSVEYGLVMPFVTVRSKGGPHDDESYVAGWEMGKLDTFLTHQNPAIHTDAIYADSEPQADRIAMKHGYTASFTAVGEGWVHMELTKGASL